MTKLSARDSYFRGPMRRLAVVTAALLLSTDSADAFAPGPRQPARRAFVVSSSTSSRLQGTIYYPDGSTEDDSSTSSLYENEPETKRPVGIVDPAMKGPLARLAAKHQPGLKENQIDQINIIGCTNSHCDIEAVLCEDFGCVSLSVPVALLNPCLEDDAFADCVMENLNVLDQNLGTDNAEPASQADLEAHQRMLTELQNTNNVKYPKWWQHPDGDLQFAQQCESLVSILNEPDFAPDVMKLVLRHVIVDPEDNLFIGEAAVVAVGPSGMIVRASAMVREEGGERAKLVEMIQVPLQFDQKAETPEILREYVLSMVEDDQSS